MFYVPETHEALSTHAASDELPSAVARSSGPNKSGGSGGDGGGGEADGAAEEEEGEVSGARNVRSKRLDKSRLLIKCLRPTLEGWLEVAGGGLEVGMEVEVRPRWSLPLGRSLVPTL